MRDVEFDEDKSIDFQTEEKSGWITKMLISLHLARDARQAASVLLVISIIVLVVTVLLVLSLGSSAREEIYDPYVEGGPAILE